MGCGSPEDVLCTFWENMTTETAFISLRISRRLKTSCQWFIPVILATQEAEIRRISVRSQPGQIVHKTLSPKYPTQK
jgi:hypothetical protein